MIIADQIKASFPQLELLPDIRIRKFGGGDRLASLIVFDMSVSGGRELFSFTGQATSFPIIVSMPVRMKYHRDCREIRDWACMWALISGLTGES
jgi:hypothetical protein